MSATKKQGLLSWLGNTVNDYLDRASEELLAPHVAWMEAEVSRLREEFDFEKAAAARRLNGNDRQLVAIALYHRFLRRCWQDSQLSEREQQQLAWLAKTGSMTCAWRTAISTSTSRPPPAAPASRPAGPRARPSTSARGKLLIDAEDNRWVVPDLAALPKADREKFERYVYW